jgi:hypothetical protein
MIMTWLSSSSSSSYIYIYLHSFNRNEFECNTHTIDKCVSSIWKVITPVVSILCRFTLFSIVPHAHAYVSIFDCYNVSRWNFLRAQCFELISSEREIETLLIISAASLLVLLNWVSLVASMIRQRRAFMHAWVCFFSLSSLFLFGAFGELAHAHTRSSNRPSIAVKHGTFSWSLEMHTHIHIHMIAKKPIRVIVVIVYR